MPETTLALYEDARDGPEQWAGERDRELDGMDDVLRYKTTLVLDTVSSVYGTQGRLDGSAVRDHAAAVSFAAARLAETFYGDATLVSERRYSVRVCELAGLLHEVAACSRTTYEDVLQVSDESVANAVGALTPHNGEPCHRRAELLANCVGRAGTAAQLVKICDLAHDGMMYDSLVEARTPGVREPVRFFVTEMEVVLNSFHDVDKHPRVQPLVAHLRGLCDRLDTWLRGRDGSRRARR